MTDIAAIHREIVKVAWSGGSLAILDVYSPDYTFVGPLAPDVRGPEGERALIAERRASFSDLRFEVHEQLVDGDCVATRWTAYGTHDGPLGPMPPTGRSGSADGVAIALRGREARQRLDDVGRARAAAAADGARAGGGGGGLTASTRSAARRGSSRPGDTAQTRVWGTARVRTSPRSRPARRRRRRSSRSTSSRTSTATRSAWPARTSSSASPPAPCGSGCGAPTSAPRPTAAAQPILLDSSHRPPAYGLAAT
jgi:hypothetical protein